MNAAEAVSNIAKRKRDEEAQQLSERRFRQFFATLPEYCYMISPDGNILDANPAACEGLGYDEDELIGKPLSIIYAPESQATLRDLFEKWKKLGKLRNEELVILTKQGEKRTVLVNAGSVTDAKGNLLHSTSVQVDITERKQLEKSLLWRLQFESLLSDLSRTFIGLPEQEIDVNMESGLARLGKFLEMDRITLFEFSPDRTKLSPTYAWNAPGVEKAPLLVSMKHLPWWSARVLCGEASLASQLDDLPEEASAEKEYLRQRGIVSLASIPLEVGGQINGAISFVSMRRQVLWTEDLVSQLRVIGDIFWNALKRKHAMETLRAAQATVHESQDRFRLAMNNVASGVYTLDLQGLVTYVNPAAEEMFGWTNAELLGKKMHGVTHYMHPDGTPFPASDCPGLQVLQKGTELREHEDVFIRKDGSFFPVVYSASPLKKGSQTVGIVVGFRDDTSRREAERTVRESEERFRLVANTAPVMIWMSGIDKLCTYFNKTWLDFTGRSLEEELGNGWAEGIHPEDLEECLKTYTKAFDSREPFRMQYRLRRHDGEYCWIFDQGVPRFNSEGAFVGYIGSCVDITERKRAEEALRQKDRELSEAQRLAGVGSWHLDVRNDIVIWSEELYRIAGLDPTLPAPIYKETPRHFTAESWERLQFAVEKALRDGTSYELDLEMVRPNGTTRWIRARGEAVGDATGRIVGLRGTVQDITERKLAEEVLSTASQKLIEAQEQERSRLARELHDDINQRIALLAFNLEDVKQALPSRQVQLRRRLANECTRVSELGHDIQALSHRLHSSKLEYVGLVGAARGFCAELADLEHVEIDFRSENVPQELPKETSLCLFRILQEALQNAVKHSGSTHFQVSLGVSLNRVELTVHDSGIGFKPDEAIRGRGLGLTSMKERLKLIDGQLSIESQPGAGTTIRATAPLCVGSEPQRTSLKAQEQSA